MCSGVSIVYLPLHQSCGSFKISCETSKSLRTLRFLRMAVLAKGFQRPLEPGLHPCFVDFVPKSRSTSVAMALIPHTKDLVFVVYGDPLLPSYEFSTLSTFSKECILSAPSTKLNSQFPRVSSPQQTHQQLVSSSRGPGRKQQPATILLVVFHHSTMNISTNY